MNTENLGQVFHAPFELINSPDVVGIGEIPVKPEFADQILAGAQLLLYKFDVLSDRGTFLEVMERIRIDRQKWYGYDPPENNEGKQHDR
jgi:hypothetical protein